jgi:hypothetical protein
MVLILPVLIFCAYVGRLWTVPVGIVSWLLPAYFSGRLSFAEVPDLAAAIGVICFCGIGLHHVLKLTVPGFARA